MKRKYFIMALLTAALTCNAQDFQMELRILRQENAELRYQVEELRQALADKDVTLTVPWASLIKGRIPAPEDYIAGLQMIDEAVLVSYTDVMKEYIDYFNVVSAKKMKSTARLFRSMEDYFNEVFAAYGVPTDVAALAVVESAMNPRAVSSAGAVGLWQIMPTTAHQYGLKTAAAVEEDERTAVEKATPVAARILAAAYRRYGSWPLAVSAYNCGPGNVDKAIAKAGTDEFWAVWDHLPRETQGYLPSLIGVLYYLKTNPQE